MHCFENDSFTTYFVFRMMALRKTFNKLDKDGSGFLTKDEIMNAFEAEKKGKGPSREKIECFIECYDKDGDGKVLLLGNIHLT